MRPRFTLYGNFASGNVYKVALTLTLSSASYEYRHVPILEGATRTPEFVSGKNRFGEVPVLVDTARDDLTLVQSGAILWYLAHELSRFAGKTPEEDLHVLEWLMFDNHRILPAVARLRAFKRYVQGGSPDLLAYFEAQATAALDTLERHLSDHAFLVGDDATIADLQCCAYLFLLAETGIDGKGWPAVQAWLARIAALPGYVPQYDLLPQE